VNRIQTSLDLLKDERSYVLKKLQNMCEKAFQNEEPEKVGSPKKPSMAQ